MKPGTPVVVKNVTGSAAANVQCGDFGRVVTNKTNDWKMVVVNVNGTDYYWDKADLERVTLQ